MLQTYCRDSSYPFGPLFLEDHVVKNPRWSFLSPKDRVVHSPFFRFAENFWLKKTGGWSSPRIQVQVLGWSEAKAQVLPGPLQFFVPVQDSPPPRSKTPEPLPPSDEELRQVFLQHFPQFFFLPKKLFVVETTQTDFFVEFSQFYWLGEMIQFHPIFQMGLVQPPASLGWSQVEFPSLLKSCSSQKPWCVRWFGILLGIIECHGDMSSRP